MAVFIAYMAGKLLKLRKLFSFYSQHTLEPLCIIKQNNFHDIIILKGKYQ